MAGRKNGSTGGVCTDFLTDSHTNSNHVSENVARFNVDRKDKEEVKTKGDVA